MSIEDRARVDRDPMDSLSGEHGKRIFPRAQKISIYLEDLSCEKRDKGKKREKTERESEGERRREGEEDEKHSALHHRISQPFHVGPSTIVGHCDALAFLAAGLSFWRSSMSSRYIRDSDRVLSCNIGLIFRSRLHRRITRASERA